MPPRICVVGSSNMDLIVRAPRFPLPGETLPATSFTTCPGGKGGNQAVMAARLGAQVTMVSRVGTDPFGDLLLDNYRRQRIDITHVRRDRTRSTGVATILVEDGGANSILVAPGANDVLTVADVHRAKTHLRAADVLLCQGEVPLETTAAALELAHGSARDTILNLSPYRPVPDELLRYVSVLVVNETELAQMTSLSGTSDDLIAAAVDRLFERLWGTLDPQSTRTILVTVGARGVYWHSHLSRGWKRVLRVKAVDTTGAGDALAGAFAACHMGVLHASDWEQALEQAMALASLTVTRPGTQSSYPNRRESRAWLLRHRLGK